MYTAVVFGGLVLTGVAFLPRALDAVRVFADPITLVRYQLGLLPSSYYVTGIEDALTDDDPELAQGIYDLAVARRVSVPDQLKTRLIEAQTWPATMARKARCVGRAAMTDSTDCVEGLAVNVLTDLTVVGDVKDLVGEAKAWPNYDGLTVGLAGVGIVATAATYGGGVGFPARVGVSIVKVAYRSGRISVSLLNDFRRLATRAIDNDAARQLMGKVSRLDARPWRWDVADLARSARQMVRANELRRLEGAASNLNDIRKTSGLRATLDTLQTAESVDDIARLGKLARVYKASYRGMLRLVGRGVPRLTKWVVSIVQGALAVVGWLLTAIWLAFRVVRLVFAFCSRLYRLVRSAVAPRALSPGVQLGRSRLAARAVG